MINLLRQTESGVFVAKPYPIMIAVAIVLHSIWAITVALDPSAINATAVHTVLVISKNDPHVASAIFATAAFLAMIGFVVSGRNWRLAFILPQQVVLWFSMTGALTAMTQAQFADGTVRSHGFLIVDQASVVLIAFGHAAALFLIATQDGHEYHG